MFDDQFSFNVIQITRKLDAYNAISQLYIHQLDQLNLFFNYNVIVSISLDPLRFESLIDLPESSTRKIHQAIYANSLLLKRLKVLDSHKNIMMKQLLSQNNV